MSRAASTTARAVGTWFGCGLVPKAPGTMGTLGALPLYWLVVREGGQLGVAVAALLVTAVGVWAASVVQSDLGIEDPQIVVIDEVAGMLVTMIPVAGFTFRATAIGFVLFRLLDVWKPWPIRRFEALPSGWGIVLDDVAAGVIGAAVMLGLRLCGAVR
jgi:phosphatidylglycerophosphatase A